MYVTRQNTSMGFKKVRFYNDEKNYTQKYAVNPLPVCRVSAALSKPEAGGIGYGKQRTSTASTFQKFKIFLENHSFWHKGILDPGSDIFQQWNRVFLFFFWVALFLDPLFFYIPEPLNNNGSLCLKSNLKLEIVITFFRSVADIFYALNIVVKFQTAYVSPSSRGFGKGELVMDRKMIARRYLRSEFFVDLMAALPLPQIMIWFILPVIKSSQAYHTHNTILLIVLLQYIPKLYLIYPLSSRTIKASRVVTQTAWSGAAYNLLLYMLVGHVLGASFYLLGFERYATCLESECKNETSPVQCIPGYLDCNSLSESARQTWASTTVVFSSCDPNNDLSLNFGIFTNALKTYAFSSVFLKKYLYFLWFGVQSMSCYGNTLITSANAVENAFSILAAVLGLILIAHLIGNVQTYLQSLTMKIEEWRLKQQDTMEWMEHRQLPQDLQGRVQQFVQYKWLATQGVDENLVLRELPMEFSRDIRRHLCLDLLLRVPFFSQMDNQLLDAISERLVSFLSIEGTYIVHEGEPVTEMLFIIRGRLESSTTNGGRTGFFNSITLKSGDFCGEELLAWALLPKSSPNLPSSTRTVRTLDVVEAFVLQAEDLKFVANQFRYLHSKKLQHTFRFHSSHWRTWAACFIQAAWHRHKKRIMVEYLNKRESFSYSHDKQVDEMKHDVKELPFGRRFQNKSIDIPMLLAKIRRVVRGRASLFRNIKLSQANVLLSHSWRISNSIFS